MSPQLAAGNCGALARPNVLMFGDGGWQDGRTAQQDMQLSLWLEQVHRPVVIELGAGTQIPSVRYFSHEVVLTHGGRLVRINPRENSVPTKSDVGLASGALQALRAMDVALDRRS